MFGIGMQELMVVLVIALLVIGPKKLPELARTLGKGMRELRRASDDLRTTIMVDMDEPPIRRPHPQRPALPEMATGAGGERVIDVDKIVDDAHAEAGQTVATKAETDTPAEATDEAKSSTPETVSRGATVNEAAAEHADAQNTSADRASAE